MRYCRMSVPLYSRKSSSISTYRAGISGSAFNAKKVHLHMCALSMLKKLLNCCDDLSRIGHRRYMTIAVNHHERVMRQKRGKVL